VGVVATTALPILMQRSRHPLIPLDLFRSRNFAVTNLSTLLIYGALYVAFYYLTLFQQGTLGYTAAAAGAGGVPGALFLVFFSTRFGSLAAKYGPRLFMAVGPMIAAIGILWFARVPASSTPWKLQLSDLRTYVPPLSYFTDFLPGSILFGVGMMILVAPLTTALMTSVPVRNSGVGSAINNALSRVGPQLAGALVFIFLTANFYSMLASRLPGVDVSSSTFRSLVSPLNTPPDLRLVAVVRDASTSALHLAMLVGAGLLLAGALVNAIGISNPGSLKRQPAAQSEPAAQAGA
jgi:hypothetical protein